MSKVQTMPLEIWTDINGNAARTQFKGGTKYIRAGAQATVEALQRERDILLRQVDTQRRTIQRYQASRHEHTELQALVRAFSNHWPKKIHCHEGAGNWSISGIPITFWKYEDAKLFLELLNTLDATTPVCQVCNGANGVPGNENIVNGVVMCDYCHAKGGDGE